MPTNIGVSIGGAFVSLPGAYYTDSLSPVSPVNQLVTGPLVFVAYGYGGAPVGSPDFQPVNYTNGNELIAAMRGSPSADLVNFMINPSTELNGVQLITYIPIGTNTQSTANMQGNSDSPQTVINLTSVDYGVPSNLLSYSVSSASVSGVAVTITDNYAGVSYTQDNLGYPFELAYTGTASGVTYKVTGSNNVATGINITSPNPGESVSITFNNTTLNTVQQLIGFLDGTGFYSANILSQGQLPVTSLDVASDVSLPQPTGDPLVYQYVNVSAILGDVVYFINNTPTALAKAVIAESITSSPAVELIPVAQIFFSGAQNTAPTTEDYADGFNAALNVPAWIVFADSNNAAVQALGAQHAYDASQVTEGKWRRFITGSSLGDSITTTIANARGLNEYQTTYVYPGIQRTNISTGLNQFYDGLHVAAGVAGMMTGNPISTPLTNKTMIGNGVEVTLTNDNLITLETNGVMVLNYPQQINLPTILLDVTTWLNDSNPGNVYNQQVSERFGLAYALVNGLQSYVGTVASTTTLAAATNATIGILNGCIYNGVGGLGFLNSWNSSTLVLTYTSNNQSLNVAVSVQLVGQIAFIPINVVINPLNIASTGS